MVEMVETAAILNQAGERALVILDEIGRGTATFDGLSIAWAAIEHLHEDNRCRALFATHFHELTALAAKLAAAAQRHRAGEGMARRRRVPARGGGRARPTAPTASRWRSSPACRAAVIERAKLVLAQLEAERPRLAGAHADRRPAAVRRDARRARADSRADELAEALAALNPDEMSPREALDALYALKLKAGKREP